jgi:hypothetical protein
MGLKESLTTKLILGHLKFFGCFCHADKKEIFKKRIPGPLGGIARIIKNLEGSVH